MKPIIEIKGIGKKYNITHQKGGYITLRDVLTNIARRPFSFAKQRVKRAVGLETKEEFWALRDINLNIGKGEIIGIIGANGAGKSTLLKILTGITPPTEGEIIIRGRVASLLEVGTGFHPELTGRENIFLNGAILGMTRREIAQKFDEIVAFAGIDKFLDTPVKRYSSGMYVRLAFSVAAHMEPDILLVDEVLAVGDAEFQKKCLGKMEEVTRKDGRTILFVSHNMGAIQKLCQKTAVLDQGKVIHFGDTQKAIALYSHTSIKRQSQTFEITEGGLASMEHMAVTGDLSEKNVFDVADEIDIHVRYRVRDSLHMLQLALVVSKDGTDVVQMFDTDDEEIPVDKEPGVYETVCRLPGKFLKAGDYSIRATLGIPEQLIQDTGPVIGFEIQEHSINTQHKSYKKERGGLIISPARWNTHKQSV